MGGYLAETAPPQRSAGQTMRPCASMASFISLDMTSGPRMRSKARRSSRSTEVGTTAVTVAARFAEERSASSPKIWPGSQIVFIFVPGCLSRKRKF